MRKIVLASASRRRSEILTSCGIVHVVMPNEIEEIPGGEGPISEVVELNAIKKAEFALTVCETEEDVIIGADTLVMCGDVVLGKPKNEEEAKAMLRAFSGKDIFVYTGICVIDALSGRKSVGVDKSEISVTSLKEGDADRYFPLLGPYDKAGGFSIEGVGAMLFDDIRGSYFNILGLSVVSLKKLFENTGLDLLDFIDRDKL